MNRAKIIGTAPRIYVEYVEETLQYYIENLGFELLNKVPGIYGMIKRDEFQIHFAKFSDSFPNLGQRQHILLWIPDIECFWKEIETKKLNILENITLKPYGNREFIIEDLNKNIITICD